MAAQLIGAPKVWPSPQAELSHNCKEVVPMSSSVIGMLPRHDHQAHREPGDRHDRLQAAGGPAAGRGGVRLRTQVAAEVIRASGAMLEVSVVVRVSSPSVAAMLWAPRHGVSSDPPYTQRGTGRANHRLLRSCGLVTVARVVAS